MVKKRPTYIISSPPKPTKGYWQPDSAPEKEIWVTPSGKTVVTSTTSAAALDEAMEKYEGALKRLAKR